MSEVWLENNAVGHDGRIFEGKETEAPAKEGHKPYTEESFVTRSIADRKTLW